VRGLAPDFVRTEAAQRLRALAHPDRLRIVEVLSTGPAHVGEIAARLRLSVNATSRHLRVLDAARVVDRSQRGNHVLYVLADRDVERLAAVAYRGAATQARRVIALAPDSQADLMPSLDANQGDPPSGLGE
jgi:DNA-binding transcriptional ArsR family regulator